MTSYSIIIPVHNREKTLQICIDSILSQTNKNYELILVDDHSTDNSVKIIKDYCKLDKRIVLVEQPDSSHGAQAARQAGVMAAKNEWLMFNDSDDTWVSEKIEKQEAVLAEYSFDPDVCLYSNCILYNINSREETLWNLPVISLQSSFKDLLLSSGPMFQSLCCSKTLLMKAGGIDVDVPAYQEWDTSLLLAKHGGKFVKIAQPLFKYYVGAPDAISKSCAKDLMGRFYIYSKYEESYKTLFESDVLREKYIGLYEFFLTHISDLSDWMNETSLCSLLNHVFENYGNFLLQRNRPDISLSQLIRILSRKTLVSKVYKRFTEK